MSKFDLADFPESGFDLWADNALKELKSKPLESLDWYYDPDVIIRPYYDKNDQKHPPVEGLNLELLPDQQTGRLWHCLEPIPAYSQHSDSKKLNESALEALNQGADGILWMFGTSATASPAVLLKNIGLQYCQTVFQLASWGDNEQAFLQKIFTDRQLVTNTIPGFLLYDPMASVPEVQSIEKAIPPGLGFRPHCFDATSAPVCNLSPTDQVAYLLSSFISRTKILMELGLSLQAIVDRSVFCVTLGRDFFHEMAKVRALKIALSQVANHFEAEATEPSDIRVFARPATGTHSVVDPYVNLIRLTTAAVAGIAGGANYMSIPRFDARHPFTKNGFAQRISRNISSLLRDESYFDKVADPVSGSYFIEELTGALAGKAWETMQKAEAIGGFAASISQDVWTEKANEFQTRETRLINTRKLNVVGVNNYCDLSLFKSFPSGSEAGINDTPLSSFESLRLKVENYLAASAGAQRPVVVAVIFGDRQAALARYRFIQGLFPAAGIEVSDPVHWSAEGTPTLPDNVRLAVMCSSDEGYLTDGPPVYKALKETNRELHLVVAGNPGADEELLTQAGIDSFVHIKSDFIAMLTSYQNLFGI